MWLSLQGASMLCCARPAESSKPARLEEDLTEVAVCNASVAGSHAACGSVLQGVAILPGWWKD